MGSIQCAECKKKVGIFGFQCKCENTYCNKHRHSFSHKCTFNWVDHDKEKLKEQVVKVMGDKVIKI